MNAKDTLRIKLPGFQQETLMAAEGKKELWHVLSIRGCMDQLVDASCFQIRRDHWLGGKDTTCYGTIEQAREAWKQI